MDENARYLVRAARPRDRRIRRVDAIVVVVGIEEEEL